MESVVGSGRTAGSSRAEHLVGRSDQNMRHPNAELIRTVDELLPRSAQVNLGYSERHQLRVG